MRDKQIKKFLKERDAMIETQSIEEFKKFYARWQKIAYDGNPLIQTDEVLEISLRKMALGATKVSKETKKEAAAWLIDRGYHVG